MAGDKDVHYSTDAATGVFSLTDKLEETSQVGCAGHVPLPSCLVPALLRSKCLARGSPGLRGRGGRAGLGDVVLIVL
jgi:hypothetical protein